MSVTWTQDCQAPTALSCCQTLGVGNGQEGILSSGIKSYFTLQVFWHRGIFIHFHEYQNLNSLHPVIYCVPSIEQKEFQIHLTYSKLILPMFLLGFKLKSQPLSILVGLYLEQVHSASISTLFSDFFFSKETFLKEKFSRCSK